MVLECSSLLLLSTLWPFIMFFFRYLYLIIFFLSKKKRKKKSGLVMSHSDVDNGAPFQGRSQPRKNMKGTGKTKSKK